MRDPRAGAAPEKVVVLVAPADAVSVVRSVLGEFQDDFPAAIVVLLQEGDRKERPLADNLDRRSSLLVSPGREGMLLRHGRVVVVVGNHSLALGGDGRLIAAYGDAADNDALLLEDRATSIGDSAVRSEPLLASIAVRYGRAAVAIALTVRDSNESEGFRRIRATGGHTIALDESDQLWESRFGAPRRRIQADPEDEHLRSVEIANRVKVILEHGPEAALR